MLFANQSAQRIGALRDCYRVKAHRLQLTDSRSQRALEAFLSRQPIEGSCYESPHCVSSRGDCALRYFVFVEWLAGSAPDDESSVLLSIYEPHLAKKLSHKVLTRLYGLTPMESKLVASLYIEPVLQTAARHGGISLNTAKTHLKHIFVKCGVRSKAELLRLLALGPRTQ
jgi:DNA-binding CsgD family transcriptional regulator